VRLTRIALGAPITLITLATAMLIGADSRIQSAGIASIQPAPDQPALPPTMPPKPALPRTITNSIGMELVLIQPGTLLVGRFEPACPSPADRASSDRDSPAQHPRARWTPADTARCEEIVKRERRSGFAVTLPNAYYIGKYEVTQGEWTTVMGSNPSAFQGRRVDGGGGGGDATRHPVDSVTWDAAQRFVQTLNAREKTTAYRLPTEFEWEHAARAGASTDPSWDEIRELAWEQDVTTAMTHPVGLKKPNRSGLHDMLGNVWEWVSDYYNEQLFAAPEPPRSGTTHVLKGGGFLSDVKNTTYSTHAAGPGDRFDVGFRIVRDLPAR
jgi:formylglycine-generating enzyme required for sulfatase activity